MIILLVLNLLGVGLLWYGYSTMQEKKAQEADLRSQIAEESQKGLKLKVLSETLASAERDREALEKYLFDPSEESQIGLISQMEHLGISTTGALVSMTSLELSTADPKSLHGELAISGTWSQLYYLLRLIEVLPTKVVIGRFAINTTPSTSGTDVPAKSGPDRWVGTLSFDFASLRSTQ